MVRPKKHDLEEYRVDLAEKFTAGASEKDILQFLADEGVQCSESTLKRNIRKWRAASLFPIGRTSKEDQQRLKEAVLAVCQDLEKIPTDKEIFDIISTQYDTSERQIKRIRIEAGVLRRDAARVWRPPDSLTNAILARLEEDPENMPKDNALAEEMNSAGFDTCEDEVFSIRKRFNIKHLSRGPNRHGPSRNAVSQTPLLDDESESDEPDEDGAASAPVPKISPGDHRTVIDLDAETVEVMSQILPAVKRLVFYRHRRGVKIVHNTGSTQEAVKPLLDELRITQVNVTAMYISQNVLVPDYLFGCWLIPLEFRRERERLDDETVGLVDTIENERNYIGEINMKLGQAMYLTKPTSINCRMTALLLSR